MNSHGQFWSLDVVLAAVVFTLAIGVITSQAELGIFYSQQERNQHELVSMALLASNNLVSQSDVIVESPEGMVNVRCGPNFTWESSILSSRGWVADNELSWLENCVVSRNVPLHSSVLSIPPTYGLDVSGLLADDTPILFYADNSPSSSYLGITRKMVVFPDHPLARDIRECMDGICSNYLTDITLRVWRV